MQIINVDRLNSLPGCGPFNHDRAIVVSGTEKEPHIISGQLQPKVLFRGELQECHLYVLGFDRGLRACTFATRDECSNWAHKRGYSDGASQRTLDGERAAPAGPRDRTLSQSSVR